ESITQLMPIIKFCASVITILQMPDEQQPHWEEWEEERDPNMLLKLAMILFTLVIFGLLYGYSISGGYIVFVLHLVGMASMYLLFWKEREIILPKAIDSDHEIWGTRKLEDMTGRFMKLDRLQPCILPKEDETVLDAFRRAF
ncbi:hypothetical protein PMAYCL1PPCAC_20105, partial [Pristionchus mayeri]